MLKTELLSGNHDRESFDCGEPALNEFLLKTARQHIRKGISRTFVLIDETVPNDILGYYTLTVLCNIPFEKTGQPPVLCSACRAFMPAIPERTDHVLPEA